MAHPAMPRRRGRLVKVVGRVGSYVKPSAYGSCGSDLDKLKSLIDNYVRMMQILYSEIKDARYVIASR